MAVRLTDAQVREVRDKFREGARQVDLASEYGISQNTVSSLVLGRTRRAAGGPLSPGTARKLDVEEVRLIRHELATGGTSQAALAHQYGVSQQMIGYIATGRAFADVSGPLIGARRAKAPPLTEEQVEDIRDRVQDGNARQLVADAFGVSLSTVNAVMSGRATGRSGDYQRFTRDEIKFIRQDFRDGTSQRELAGCYGTTQQTISAIVRGLMYPSYGGPIAGARSRKLTRHQVEAIRKAFRASASVTELALQYGLDWSQVVSVLTGATYATYPGPLVDPEAI